MAPGTDSPSAGIRVAARTLALDANAAGIARALRSGGVRPILLKGPSISRWLYDADEIRGYVDVDLLISLTDWAAAASVLTAGGFDPTRAELALPHGRRPHAETWARERDGVTVDLHDTLPGLGASPVAVWEVLAHETETMTVAGAELEVLNEPARALLVTLHAAHHGIDDRQALSDLTRALARVSEATWRDVAALAKRLDAVPSFAAGLRLTPEGSQLAERLALPAASSVETILRASSAPELALSLDWLVRTPGIRARARLIGRRLAPPASVLRGRSELARRGKPGLGAAYVLQMFWLGRHALPAVRAWLAARKRIS